MSCLPPSASSSIAAFWLSRRRSHCSRSSTGKGSEASHTKSRRASHGCKGAAPFKSRRSRTRRSHHHHQRWSWTASSEIQYFAECLLDERDVDVSKFITACRHFGTVLEKAGPFTMLSIRETHSNIAKIENTFLLVREPLHKWGSDPVRVLSLAHLLAASSTALIALHPSHSHLVLFRILIASARW